MFYEQLELLCNENGTTPTAFVRDVLNLSTSKVTAWSKGSIPKIGILKEIASYFNVTVGYLFDGKKENSSSLSKNEKECLAKFKLLTETEQGKILDRMDVFIEEREASRKGA